MKGVRRLPFPGTEQLRGFDEALTETIADSASALLSEIVPPENTHFLTHGQVWQHDRDSADPVIGGFQKHEAGAEVKADDIANNELEVLSRFPLQLVNAIHGATMRSLYETVGKAAEQVGNVISAGGKPFTPELFLELLRKVDLSIDRDGQLSMPQLHVHPETAKKMIPLLESQGSEFQAKVAEITAEKEREARTREEARLGKFRNITGDK